MVAWRYERREREISYFGHVILHIMNAKYWNFYILYGIKMHGNFVIANVKY